MLFTCMFYLSYVMNFLSELVLFALYSTSYCYLLTMIEYGFSTLTEKAKTENKMNDMVRMCLSTISIYVKCIDKM